MKKICVPMLSLLVFIACDNKSTIKTPELLTAEDSLSYALGINIGESLQKQGIENLNTDVISVAIHQAFADDTTALFDNQSAVTYLNAYFQKKQMEVMEKELAEGQKFLEENAKKPGIQVSPSGLQYEIIREGTGAMPSDSDRVVVHYRGTLTDGTEFESSYQSGEPVTFGVTEVVPGWTEGLKMMKEGAAYRLYIPSELAFGAMSGGPIPPNSVVIFDLELIKVNP